MEVVSATCVTCRRPDNPVDALVLCDRDGTTFVMCPSKPNNTHICNETGYVCEYKNPKEAP